MSISRFFPQKNSLCKAAAMFCVAAAMALTACAGGGDEEESTVSITREGKINSHIVESFDKNYYDKDELQQRILQEAASYNRAAGEGAVSVEKVIVENGFANVEMTYGKASDYADFNNRVFFIGTAKEAQEAGYDLNTVLSSVKDEYETVGKSDILAMEDVLILITDVKEPVTLNGKAVYISGNVVADKKLKTVYFDEESEELAYILYTD